MNHEDNCQICREGIDRPAEGQRVFSVLDKARNYYHVVAKNSLDAIKKLNLTGVDTYVLMLTKKEMKKLIKKRLEVIRMGTELEKNLAEVQKWADFGHKVAQLFESLEAAPKKKKRHRRTKAEIEAAKAEAKSIVGEPVPTPAKPKPKRSRKPKTQAAVSSNSAEVPA